VAAVLSSFEEPLVVVPLTAESAAVIPTNKVYNFIFRSNEEASLLTFNQIIWIFAL
jgi:hypothetical protein